MFGSGQPVDFASIHAYENYAAQLGALRGALPARPDLPLFLTEYASYTGAPGNYGPKGRISRHEAAACFFRDVKGLLAFTDAPKVYWAQWVDDSLGLLCKDLHRKALFNAFKIYGMMPVDRNALTISGSGVDAMASSDEHQAAVVLWNALREDREIRVSLRKLAFAAGKMELRRIDREHASFVDNPASEDLDVLGTIGFENSAAQWQGVVPAGGVVFLRLHDGTPSPLAGPNRLGTLVRNLYWFFDRGAGVYADFDPRTFVARVGQGGKDFAVALTGAVVEEMTPRFKVQVRKAGSFQKKDRNSVFGLRLDFQGKDGSYVKSVLFHNGLYDATRDSAWPWAKGGAVPDQAIRREEMNTGQPFEISLADWAPADWNGKRLVLSFILRNAGGDSRARFVLSR
jgi:hypothetical protein